ncbi:MAG: hypothetical protein D3920_07835 [Candidatus Electrothrix sp. AW2]|nr:hypothetical protein [Candidatus Electrothrix gigas]
MPIEIKELHIRIAVNTPSDGQTSSPTGVSTAFGNGTALDAEGKDALVAECVEQVLEILQHKNER